MHPLYFFCFSYTLLKVKSEMALSQQMLIRFLMISFSVVCQPPYRQLSQVFLLPANRHKRQLSQIDKVLIHPTQHAVSIIIVCHFYGNVNQFLNKKILTFSIAASFSFFKRPYIFNNSFIIHTNKCLFIYC